MKKLEQKIEKFKSLIKIIYNTEVHDFHTGEPITRYILVKIGEYDHSSFRPNFFTQLRIF